MKVLILNTSLKSSEEESNTVALAKKVRQIYDNENVVSEVGRLANYAMSYGMSPYTGDGDEWPQIFEKVKEADILIIRTPLWLGGKSSIATLAYERLHGSSADTKSFHIRFRYLCKLSNSKKIAKW
ncbi:NAD(P)H-dependent oxidoreductase [Sporosarcina sp. E16_8]|uniref:flavodoxin family protein n=1 Tax=Sporosarcina sp. E16_8 TaxID=2789295 RepID=UPI0021057C6D|nr:NAD(P)H-dependent oxidoreductase [Sporosarcina sp. E16_8]